MSCQRIGKNTVISRVISVISKVISILIILELDTLGM